ncbi:hypothetical protein G7054_g4440 [Neopestalotiopsis clavispora]|nr:hypothetical protein G7054_g4440 [Neopestalotiopsis clavispora]
MIYYPQTNYPVRFRKLQRQPDAQFQHRDAPYPGIVLEISYSQNGNELGKLAWDYILSSNADIKTVIGVDIGHGNVHPSAGSLWRAVTLSHAAVGDSMLDVQREVTSQLVGCALLLIAAKYGDKKDRVPKINELNYLCCGLYDSHMFTQMEMHMLNTLEWTIGHPTVDYFRSLIVAEEGDDCEVEHMAAYICEIALYHRDFVSTAIKTAWC